MDVLSATFQLLSPTEKRAFRKFILSEQRRPPVKMMRLISYLDTQDSGRRTDMLKLYNREEYNAWHSLRKRLLKRIQEFIVNHGERHLPGHEQAEWQISLSTQLIHRGAGKLAMKELTQALAIAENQERYDLSDKIYMIMITYASELGTDAEQLYHEWRANKRKAEMMERMTISNALLAQRLERARREGRVINIDQFTRQAFSETGNDLADNATIVLGTCTLVRNAIISTKNYVHFASFVRRQYERLKKSGHLYRSPLSTQLGLQYILAHALYRNRQFDLARTVLSEMESSLSSVRKAEVRYKARYVLLSAAISSYTGDNRGATEMLRTALAEKKALYSDSDQLNMMMNLSVYYFQQRQFKRANSLMLSMHHSDKWYEKKMGKEWLFKKTFIAIIIQYELGNTEIALQRIRRAEKYFAEFLGQEFYQRVGIFLGFIKTLIHHPELISTQEFAQKVEEANIALPGDREDIQAMAFFSWLKSKMVRRDYYEVLMETIV